MKIPKKIGRGITAANIAFNLTSMPIHKDGTPDAVKIEQQYSKMIADRQATRIRAETIKTYTPAIALDKRTSRKLRK